MERSRVAIVIPALNESATIGQVVTQVSPFGIAVVVDDGSADTTGSVARAAGAEVVTHVNNGGYDQALNSGFARAAELGCEYAITVDADGQHDTQQLQDFIRCLDDGNDLVIGVRPRAQRVAEALFSRVARVLWQVRDPLCGMKAYRMSLYRAVGHFDSFRSIGTELSIRSVAGGCKFVQLPTRIRDRQDAPRFARGLAANWKITRAMLILVGKHLTGTLAVRVTS